MAIDEVTRDELQGVITQLKEAIHIRVSFGLARLDQDIPVEMSIDRADKALYAAKSAGRDMLCT